jgi:hypothetical protein
VGFSLRAIANTPRSRRAGAAVSDARGGAAGGGTAGRFGSAVESLNILVVDGMEYTVRATSSGLQWRSVRSTLRDALASFTFR